MNLTNKYKKIFFTYISLLLIVQIILLNSIAFGQTLENTITSTSFENNSLIVNTTGKITYSESRLKDPDRLVVDILNCSIGTNNIQKDFKSSSDENISIAQISKDHVRILFFGKASINRKSFLTNNERTLIVRIARIEVGTEEKPEETQIPEEKDLPGKIREVSVEHENNETEITISATKSIKHNTYLLKNPDRFAIDLLNIAPPDKPLPKFNSTPFIYGLRVGRAANGIDATRVVIDLSKPELDCSVNSTLIGNKLKIKLKLNKQKEEVVKKSGIKVVIDPGHGGYDTGAQYGGYDEKDITLVISQKLQKSLEEKGIKAYLTRNEDSFLSLAERVDITNSIRPHVFISIHANAMKTSRTIRGVETYYWTRQSQKLAFHVHKSILNNINLPDHFIRKAKFFVIKYTSSPAVLAELAFLSNHEDRALLTSSATQDKYTKALTEAILKFLDIDTKGQKSEVKDQKSESNSQKAEQKKEPEKPKSKEAIKKEEEKRKRIKL